MMKRVLIAAFLAALAAGPAFAYVPPSDLSLNDEVGTPLGPPIRNIVEKPASGSDDPTRPVPEPGTIAMASMGLMALGVHLRRRRGN